MFPVRLHALVASLLIASIEPAHRCAASPAPESPDDAFSLVQEQTVTGPSKRPLPLSETPSSVTVVPAAEIRAMGYQTLGEALRWVSGVFVTYDRSYTYVGVRGLQRPGDYNNKVLLAVDGHTTNGSVYGDALFGPELGLDLEDVERIEVVRGPGSTLYGSYAVLAVVNVVTRRPRSVTGAAASLRAGGAGEWRGRASMASSATDGPEWQAAVSWLQSSGRDLAFPVASRPAGWTGPSSASDAERGMAFFGTLEWGQARLAVKLNEREKSVLPGAFSMPVTDDLNRTWDGRDFVELSAARRLTPALELAGRAYWDGTRYHSRTARIYEGDPTVCLYTERGDGDVAGAEARANWAVAAGQVLTAGVEAQRVLRAKLYGFEEPPPVVYDDRVLTGDLVAVYLQDEVRLGRRLLVTAGARLDDDSRYDPVVSPRADLVWTVAQGTRLKLLGGSAFRAPSPFETAPPYPGAAAPRLNAERVSTVEGTLEQERGPFTAYVTGYRSVFRDLITWVEIDDLGNTACLNFARMRTGGVEGGVRFTPGPGTHARAALAWQRSEDGETHQELTNSPRWNGHLLAYRTLRDGRTTLGAGFRYLSGKLDSDGRRSGAVGVCDARLSRELRRGVELGVEARNLFDARYGDLGWTEHLQDLILQDPRTVIVTLTIPPSRPR